MNTHAPIACLATILIASLCPVAFAETQVVFVDKDNASGTEDGLSWATAFREIEPAIDFGMDQVRNNTDTIATEVWVAEGVYDEERVGYPGNHEYQYTAAGLAGTLFVPEETSLLGGFEGNEASVEERDVPGNETTLDGSKANGGSSAPFAVALEGTLDGFRVQGRAIENSGATFITTLGPPIENVSAIVNVFNGSAIRNCTFKDFGGASGDDVGDGIVLGNDVVCEISNCVFENNVGSRLVRFWSTGSAIFQDCVFRDNASFALVEMNGPSSEFSRCTFERNDGRLLYLETGDHCFNESCDSWLRNCLVVDNTSSNLFYASDGGGVVIIGSTIANNVSTDRPRATGRSARAYVVDSIIWGNMNLNPSEPEWGDPFYSDMQNLISNGPGNLDADPLFVDPSNGDYRLSVMSPCIDAGAPRDQPLFNNGFEVEFTDHDYLGNPRPDGVAADMGAYEHMISYDVDGDGESNSNDIQNVINNVLGTSQVNLADINMDMRKDAVDIQLIINAVLGVT